MTAAGRGTGTLREVARILAGRRPALPGAALAEPRLTLTARCPGETVRYSVRLNGGSDRQKQLVRLTVFRPDGSDGLRATCISGKAHGSLSWH